MVQTGQRSEARILDFDPNPAERARPLLTLLDLISARNPTLGMHGESVGELAAIAAIDLGLSPARIERLRLAGVLHDIGKVAIADEILQKDSPLSEKEWNEVRRHPVIGSVLIESVGLDDIAEWVLKHHERPDGTGYPNGLTGDEIPLEASIISVADAYHAMVAERPYQGPLTHMEARIELQLFAGRQFESSVVDLVLAGIEQRYGKRTSEMPWGCR